MQSDYNTKGGVKRKNQKYMQVPKEIFWKEIPCWYIIFKLNIKAQILKSNARFHTGSDMVTDPECMCLHLYSPDDANDSVFIYMHIKNKLTSEKIWLWSRSVIGDLIWQRLQKLNKHDLTNWRRDWLITIVAYELFKLELEVLRLVLEGNLYSQTPCQILAKTHWYVYLHSDTSSWSAALGPLKTCLHRSIVHCLNTSDLYIIK